jgi:hypothetical protein
MSHGRTSESSESLSSSADLHSGVRFTVRSSIKVVGGIAASALAGGDQLPTVRQLAHRLAINLTPSSGYHDEIRACWKPSRAGTFISHQRLNVMLLNGSAADQLVGELAARAGSEGSQLRKSSSSFRTLKGYG